MDKPYSKVKHVRYIAHNIRLNMKQNQSDAKDYG